MVLSGCWLASTRNSENNQQMEMYPRHSSCGIFSMSPGGWPEMDLAVVFNSPSHPNKSPVLFQRGFQMQKCQVITTRTRVQHPDSLSTCKVTLCGFPNSGPILHQRERIWALQHRQPWGADTSGLQGLPPLSLSEGGRKVIRKNVYYILVSIAVFLGWI